MDDTVPAAAEERWLPISGYEGDYEVSDRGRVRSFLASKPRVPLPRLLRLGETGRRRKGDQKRYLIVRLWRGGKSRTHYVHRLVLTAFVGPCPEGAECRHLNGDRHDNRLENLCWGTRQENYEDRLRHGTDLRGERSGTCRLKEEQVLAIQADTRPHEAIAKDYAVSRPLVSMIKGGKRWGHLGASRVKRGEHTRKLNSQAVRAIRVDPRPQQKIADDYGINQVTVSLIKRRKTWAWLADKP